LAYQARLKYIDKFDQLLIIHQWTSTVDNTVRSLIHFTIFIWCYVVKYFQSFIKSSFNNISLSFHYSTCFFRIFQIFSLFNSRFFHIFHMLSLFNLLFFHIFPIFSLFILLFFCILCNIVIAIVVCVT
jgi:hypothetical protein